MKDVGGIWDRWELGLYVGTERSHARVTVEPDWYLNITSRSFAGAKNGPYRWFQREDNSQTEVEIPNVKSISIDRSLDTDFATCKLAIYNQYMHFNGETPEAANQLGRPGYFTWSRGQSDEAQGRWGQTTNDWEDVLIPNALLRTYEGYGGYNTDGTPMSIDDALAGEYITLTGVWLIDSVNISSDGNLSISCTDMGKLLRDQLLYPPLVPQSQYPFEFCRWEYEQFDAAFNKRKPILTGKVDERYPKYYDSSADRWYGENALIHGHRGTDSTDGNPDTFALSVGNYHPSRDFCTDWWEYEVNGELNEIYLHPWCGNYTMYVSILENGTWLSNGEGNILYSEADLYGTQPVVVDTGADIPYVMKTGVPWETGVWYKLPRTYKAQRIRITFRNHTQSIWGPWYYRCGIREFKIKVNTLAFSDPPAPITYTGCTFRNPDEQNESGYWIVADDGQVFAFGDARVQPVLDTVSTGSYKFEPHLAFPIVAMCQTPSGQGYWLMQTNGSIYAYGDALFLGDGRFHAFTSNRADFIDMAVNPAGDGYWLLRRDGEVVACGNATVHGDMPAIANEGNPQSAYYATGIESHPTLDGYWIINGNGEVRAFGSLTSYGGVAPYRSNMFLHEWCPSIKRTSTGNGYWILGGGGHVWAFGDAEWYGEGIPEAFVDEVNHTIYEDFRNATWEIIPAGHDGGYMLLQAKGTLIIFGSVDFFGNPGGTGTLRKDGNYKDYADIVRLLLGWSGWLLYDLNPLDRGEFPPIYGNIENTGVYADECLDPSIFDKKPPIDAINTFKEIVGYNFYIDDEGAARFESPNWWSIGNFFDDGTVTDFIPEVDERTVLFDYAVQYGDESARSEIIITTEDPRSGDPMANPIVTRIVPQSSTILRGMVKPAMWINGVFQNPDEQRIMAELIAMHIWFQQRQGQVTCLANPCIQINDQVRIFERTTSETYVHYVRGITTNHDLDTGEYTMTLTTHWLGNEEDWVITRDYIPTGGVVETGGHIYLSDALVEWLDRSEAAGPSIARVGRWKTSVDADQVFSGDPIEDGGGPIPPLE